MTDIRRTVEAVWRMESPRLIARLARLLGGDVGRAEDCAQDALLAALQQWPDAGVPNNPGGWLATAARRRAIDLIRANTRHEAKQEAVAYESGALTPDAPDYDTTLDDDVGDDVLRLIFISCHTVLSTEARVALTLRLIGGLSTEEIARAFLVPSPTIGQRIVRAKRTLSEAQVPFEMPRGDDRTERLGAVLEVLYLVFNEGYSATAGDDVLRPALCLEALRLGRVLAELVPDEPEVHGLVALMELQASRNRARVAPDGASVLLLEQDRSRWDRLLIRRGIAALDRAIALGHGLGPIGLQAAIAACHARAVRAEDTDWMRIVALYDALAQVAPSPVVQLNRAVAVGQAFGPEAALEIVDGLRFEAALRNYHYLPAARADLLLRLGRLGEARLEFEKAASLTANQRERESLLQRARAAEPHDRNHLGGAA
jgi:RNA polymerase sigma factor (sigma-70 family)